MTENDPNLLQELEKAKQAYSSGNYAAAEPLLREVFEKLETMPLEMAYCAEGLSEIYTAWGKFSEAIRLNQRLINLTAPNPGQSLDALGAALERIAAISLKVGKQEQFEKLSRLAGAVRAGKVDPNGLVTERAKMPMAPPTTEHTFTFRALGPDAPPPPGVNAPASPAPAAPPPQPPLPNTSSGAYALPAPGTASPPAGSFAPQQPAAPKPATPDVLGKPIKETAMFSRPNIAGLSGATPPTPPGVPPGSPAGATPTQPTANLNANLAKQGDIPDYQLADFDEEIAVDPSSMSGSHPPVAATPMAAPPAAPVPTAPAPPAAPAAPAGSAGSAGSIGSLQSDSWGPADSADADISDGWGTVEPEETAESKAWGPAESSNASDSVPSPQKSSFASAPAPSAPAPSSSAFPASAPHQFASPPQLAQQSSPAAAPMSEPASQQPFSSGSPPGADLPAFPQQSTFGSLPSSLPGPEPEIQLNSAPPSSSESSSSHSASSARSIRSMSSRNMSAPPVSSGPDMGGIIGTIAQLFVGKRDPDQAVQQLVDPGTTSAKAAGALVIVVGMVFGLFYSAYHFIPRKINSEQAFRALQHRYASADSTETLALIDSQTCEFAIGEQKMKTQLRFYLDDWRDAVDMALGRVGQKQIWLVNTDDGIVDQDDVKLYVKGGPEAQLANRVEFINQYATMHFARTKKYPESGDLNDAVDLHYRNPYTKKGEAPAFFRVVVGKGLASHEADEARTKFYDTLLSGGIPSDTAQAHPGEIRCYVVDFLSPRGVIQGLVVQLIGKDGKPVSGVRPKTSYVFALEDGKEYKPVGPGELPFKGEPGLRPAVVWLLMDKLDGAFVFFLTSGPVIILTILTFVFLVMSLLIPKGLGRAVAVLLLISTAIPALLFCLVKVLP